MCVCVCVYVCVHVCVAQSVMSDSLRPHGLYLARFLCPWNSSGKNTRVDCHSFLQGNLPDPRIKPGSPALQADSLLSEPLRKSLGSIYVRQHTIFVFLFLTCFILLNSVQESPQRYGSTVACLRVRVTEYNSSGRHNMLV